ncbi:XK-related protein 8 isoform X2 [Dendrobates tinctorius]|uniref:XK-related protein 8 isoform X2 n=1 Tax=Dendrobates tinctorius TaxID=92724 RepID=UPI003CC9A1CA
MLDCVPSIYRLQDLVFALVGTAAFLLDLGSDVWSTVRYYKTGDTAWAAVYIGLYALSSFMLQLLSWGWYWVDRQDSELEPDTAPEPSDTGSAAQNCGGTDYVGRSSIPANGNMKRCSNASPAPPGEAVHVTGTGPATAEVGDTSVGRSATFNPPEPSDRTASPCCADPSAASRQAELVEGRFWTSSFILRPSCLAALHLLQLGYPLRCIHSLEVGITAYRNPKDKKFKDYAYFLTHDISMMRLVETFLENTPQLILVLYIIIQREVIQVFQYVSISVSFICISWAILDYHQSLRLFLKGKQKLSILSSVIYYLWNFCLISSRILCITLFAVTFHWMIAVHFILLWSAFFLWATLQKTTFMKHKYLEIVYRATVAVILYFSWFNIADGRTRYRCLVYHVFIIIDSVVLVVTWGICKSSSILDSYRKIIIVTNIIFIAVGLFVRLLYYMYLHPNVINEPEQYYDVPDGIKEAGTNRELLSGVKTGQKTNSRITNLAMQIY